GYDPESLAPLYREEEKSNMDEARDLFSYSCQSLDAFGSFGADDPNAAMRDYYENPERYPNGPPTTGATTGTSTNWLDSLTKLVQTGAQVYSTARNQTNRPAAPLVRTAPAPAASSKWVPVAVI